MTTIKTKPGKHKPGVATLLLTLLQLTLAACSSVPSQQDQWQADDQYVELQQLTGQHRQQENSQTAFEQDLNDYRHDREFACRKPVQQSYFKQRYPSSAAAAQCDRPVPFMLLQENAQQALLWLNPNRVSEVHILFANSGDTLASRFGHILLRLVVCPDDQTNDKLQCDRNLQQHVVLSYRAHIDELKINTLKALAGSYQARLYAQPFMDVYNEYAVGQFRNLYSLPLQLDRQQINTLVQGFSQLYWGFAGDYAFLSANCSSYMQRSLALLLGEASHPALHDTTFVRPDRFFDFVQQAELVQGSLLLDLKQAENQGYYFPSTQPAYANATEYVRSRMTEPDFNNLQEYLQRNPLQRYQAAQEDPDYQQQLAQNQRLLAAQVLLEELSFIQARKLFLTELTLLLDQHAMVDLLQHSAPPGDQPLLLCLQAKLEQLTQPQLRYAGIPRADELQQFTAHQSTARQSTACAPMNSQMLMQALTDSQLQLPQQELAELELARFFALESLHNRTRFFQLALEAR